MSEIEWEIRDYDPEDEAPPGDPDHDCTGEGDRHDGKGR